MTDMTERQNIARMLESVMRPHYSTNQQKNFHYDATAAADRIIAAYPQIVERDDESGGDVSAMLGKGAI